MARAPAAGTRERILTTASRLFYAHGVRAVGMNQIIAEAGTGKNLLYGHFPTKADLVAAYLQRAGERRADSAGRAIEAAGADPREQLVALIGDVADLVRRPTFRGCAFRNYLAEFPDDTDLGAAPDAATPDAATPDAAAATPAGVAHAYLASARASIADRVGALGVDDPDTLTEQLWLIVDGLHLQAAYRDRLDDRRGTAADAALVLARAAIDAA